LYKLDFYCQQKENEKRETKYSKYAFGVKFGDVSMIYKDGSSESCGLK